MLIAEKYEIPDTCPENCEFKDGPFYQGNACSRCPIFNCARQSGPGNEWDFCLIEPEDYREDWAEEWFQYFQDLNARVAE